MEENAISEGCREYPLQSKGKLARNTDQSFKIKIGIAKRRVVEGIVEGPLDQRRQILYHRVFSKSRYRGLRRACCVLVTIGLGIST